MKFPSRPEIIQINSALNELCENIMNNLFCSRNLDLFAGMQPKTIAISYIMEMGFPWSPVN